jgi:Na+/melibiose symporter-like transporter
VLAVFQQSGINAMRKTLIVAVAIMYLIALLCLFLPDLLEAWGEYYLYFVAGVLVVHGIEVMVFFKHVKNYPGSLAISVLLTIIFGFLHWLPYKNRN